MPTEIRNLTCYEDPGHAWLKVAVSDLERLGIANKITSYSYEHATFAYLEEDCDMTTFRQAARAAGWQVTITTQVVAQTPIRTYNRYRK